MTSKFYSNPKVLLLTLATIAILWMSWRVYQPGSVSLQSRTTQDSQTSVFLDSIQEFTEPANSVECKILALEVRHQLSNSLEENSGLSSVQRSLLEEIVENRVGLLLDPNYDKYVQSVGEILGGHGETHLSGTMFEKRKLWETFAKSYRFAAVAEELVSVFDAGEYLENRDLVGGHMTTLGDPGIYGSQQVVDRGETVQDILVPMMFSPPNESSPRLLVLMIRFSFVWDSTRSKWLPYQTGVHDPTGINERIPPLWI